jgi:hypothetical protein
MRNTNWARSNVFQLSVGARWGHGNLEKLISIAILQRRNKYEKHRSKEGEGKGRQLPKNVPLEHEMAVLWFKHTV